MYIQSAGRVCFEEPSKMLYNIILFLIVCGLTFCLKKIFSPEPNNVQFQFKFFTYYFLVSVVAGIVWPFFLFSPKNVKNGKFAANILKHVTKLLKLKWELRNGNILAEDRGAVIVSNHQSSLDILGLFNIWEIVDKMTVIAKKELFYVWPFGLSAYLSGIIFINRRDTKDAFKQLQKASNIMVHEKTKIWLFPEGTRNTDYTKLLPFKKGAFTTAVNAQVPIIPVLFSPYYFINTKKYIFNKGHIVISCLEPIPTKGLTMDDVPNLMSKMYDLMQAEYNKLTNEVLSALPKELPS